MSKVTGITARPQSISFRSGNIPSPEPVQPDKDDEQDEEDEEDEERKIREPEEEKQPPVKEPPRR